MGFLSDLFSNPIQTTWDGLQQIPGSPEAMSTALYDGVNGDLSWNPYSQDNSVWDYGAGGSELSQDPDNRRVGRTIGTAIGSYFTGGLLGNVASGALWGGAAAAGSGGDRSDIFKGAARGGIGGGFSPDIAGYGGITDPALKGAVNGAVRGGTLSALNKDNIGQGALVGAAPGLASYGYSTMTAPNTDYTADNPVTYSEGQGFVPANQSTPSGGISDPAPTMTALSAGANNYTPAPAQTTQASPSGEGLMDQVSNLVGNIGINKGNVGDVIAGGMGLYDAYRKNKQAKELMRMMGGRREAYETNLRNSLQRRDAASGRRSDYSGRETQLQAALAELDSRNAPGLMGLSNMRSNAMQGGLASLWNMGKRTNWFGQGG